MCDISGLSLSLYADYLEDRFASVWAFSEAQGTHDLITYNITIYNNTPIEDSTNLLFKQLDQWDISNWKSAISDGFAESESV